MASIEHLFALATRAETARILAELALKSSVILGTAAAAAWLLRRSSAAMRHLVWSSALAVVVAMPFGSWLLPAWNVPLVAIEAPVAASIDAVSPAPSEPPLVVIDRTPRLDAVGVDAEPARVAPPPSSAPPSASASVDVGAINWIALSLGVWIAGAVFTALRLSLGVLVLWMIASRTRVMLSRDWLELTAELSRQIGLTRPVRLLQSVRATMPLSWGCTRSVVLLPADADRWPTERRRIVLLHELAHVKRRDCLTQMLAQVVCAAYWFNPLVWFAASRMRAERERACDDLVLSAGTPSADYADHLLAIARAFRSAGFPSWATVAMAKPSQLEGRLLAILDPSRHRRAWPRWASAAAVSAITLVALPVAALQPWVSAAPTQSVDAPDRDVAATHGADQVPAVKAAGASGGIEAGVAGGVQGGVPGGVDGGVRGGVEGGVHAPADAETAGALAAARDLALVRGFDVAPMLAGDLHPTSSQGALAEPVLTGADITDESDQKVADRRVIDALVSALKDENKDVRQQAAETLGRVADQRAIDGLTVALRDPSPEVREQAASALARFRSPASASALLLALKDQAPAVRREAVEGITRMRNPRYADALAMMLQDSVREVRQQAAIGLGMLRAVVAIEPLTAALKDADSDVRQQAAVALGQIRDARTAPGLITALADADEDVRQQAIVALAQLRLPSTVEPMIQALKDPDADVREQAAVALGQLRDPRGVDVLILALKDANADVRHQSVFALGQIRASSAVPALIAALTDKSADVREQAAFALGQIRDARAVDALSAALRDPDADVRQQAAFALGQLAHATQKRH